MAEGLTAGEHRRLFECGGSAWGVMLDFDDSAGKMGNQKDTFAQSESDNQRDPVPTSGTDRCGTKWPLS